jgi:hypothetical protein
LIEKIKLLPALLTDISDLRNTPTPQSLDAVRAICWNHDEARFRSQIPQASLPES